MMVNYVIKLTNLFQQGCQSSIAMPCTVGVLKTNSWGKKGEYQHRKIILIRQCRWKDSSDFRV